jgi:uncharacterized membrane protein
VSSSPKPSVTPDAARANPSGRLVAFDAARGLAMIPVCLSHFLDTWFREGGLPASAGWAYKASLIASPAYMLLSGAMLGLLQAGGRLARPDARDRLVDRALVLLVAAHAASAVLQIPYCGLAPALRLVRITDAIAVALLVCAALLPRLGAGRRASLAAALFAATWAAVGFWEPVPGSVSDTVASVLFRSAVGFPLVPWLAVFLAGTSLGELIGNRLASARSAEALLGLLSAACLAGASLLALLHLRVRQGGALAGSTLGAFVSPMTKHPPSAAYLLLYGGLALAGLLLLFRLAAAGRARRLLWEAARIGRHSLVVYVLQFGVYFSGLTLLPIPRTVPWPLAFAGSLAVVYAIARLCESAELGNAVLTAGYPWSRRRAAGAPSA